MERALREKLAGGKFENVPVAHSGRMRAIKEKGNRSTEARLRGMLVRAGIKGWVLHPNGLVGKPDFFFPKARLTIFVDGCFWHGCLKCGRVPSVNRPYWAAKIQGNQRRDRKNSRELVKRGIRVVRVWEHELAPSRSAKTLERLNRLLSRAIPPQSKFDPDIGKGASTSYGTGECPKNDKNRRLPGPASLNL